MMLPQSVATHLTFAQIGAIVMKNELQISQRIARKEQQEVNVRRQQMLLPVARALLDSERAPEVVRLGLAQVSIWKEKKLCSADYIRAWETLLNHPQDAARVLQDPSPDAVQLRQNSPFVAVIRRMGSL